MSDREKIRSELKKQKQIEGATPEIGLLFKVLGLVETKNEWRTLTQCKMHNTGPRAMIDYVRFYYPSALLKKLEKHFSEVPELQSQDQDDD